MSLLSQHRDVTCKPKTADFFGIDSLYAGSGVRCDIRRFGWEVGCDGYFEPSETFLDFSLEPRSRNALMAPDETGRFIVPGATVFSPAGAHMLTRFEGPSAHLSLCVTYQNDYLRRTIDPDHDVPALLPSLDVRSENCGRALRRIIGELREPGFASDILIESLAMSLVVELYRCLGAHRTCRGTGNGGLAPWRMKRLRDRIFQRPAGRVLIADLADDCELSVRHLTRAFQETTGMTLKQYVTQARMGHVMEMLSTTDLPIKQVASDNGFASTSAFAEAFRREIGMTPKHYRQSRRTFVSMGS